MNERVGRRRLLATCGLAAVGATGCLRLQGESAADGTDGADGSNGSGSNEGGSDGSDGPSAAFEYAPAEPHVGEEVTFDAGPSTAPGSEIVDYTWALLRDDGPPRFIGTGQEATHTFSSGGDHEVALEIFDEAGNGDRTARTVAVSGDLSEVGDVVTFEWGELFVPAEEGGDHPDDERSLAFACRTLAVLADGEPVATYDVGGRPEPLFDAGVYGSETDGDGDTFRWFGGPDGLTRMAFPGTDIGDATAIRLEGRTAVEPLGVTVSVNGTETASVTLTEPRGSYRFSTTA